MFRITTVKPPDDASKEAVVLKLEGKLLAPWLDELQSACDAHVAEGRHVTLDLTDITFVDAAGMDMLQRMHRSERIELGARSSFVQALLQTEKKHA